MFYRKITNKLVEWKNKKITGYLIVTIKYPIAYTRPDGVHVVPIGCLKN